MEISPWDFLLLAEKDLERGASSAAINCITNAKRAIVCQMDQALLTFGYNSFSWNIPKKLAALNDLGFVAPRILRRVSSARNLLEHEYKYPTENEVEEALDLAWLFVSATQSKLRPFSDTFLISNPKYASDDRRIATNGGFTRYVCLGLESEKGTVFYQARGVELRPERVVLDEVSIPSGNTEFALLVKLADAAESGVKLQQVIDELAALTGPV